MNRNAADRPPAGFTAAPRLDQHREASLAEFAAARDD